MKKIIVAFSAVCCCFITVYGQDSSSRFSVGIIGGPYFKSGAEYTAVNYFSTGKENRLNLSYGAEFTWFFKPPGNPLMKHGITARFMYSVNKYSRQYKGPYIYSSVSEIHQEMTFYSSTRNYFVSIGYRLQHAILKRLNFITGAEGILCLP